MSIEKKSLISTLKTTKKANVASSTSSPEVAHKMTKMVPKTRFTKALAKTHVKTQVKAIVKTQVKAISKTLAKRAPGRA
jgi:ribosome maturation protein Sdo1